MVTIKNLSKSFGDKKILDNISIEVKEKDILGIAGISGAGKSTLLRCINRLENFDSGELIVDGISIGGLQGEELRKYQKSTGMVFQNFSLLERANVYDNVALPMQCWGYDKKIIDKRAKELIDIVGLSTKINSKPRELSGGQKQRVAIARALMLEPKLLLCDEATSALDPNTASSVLDLLNKINKELAITIIMVTHQMEVIKQISKNLVVLRNGKLETKGKVEDIFLKNPKALQEVTGIKSTIDLPEEGKNIEIVIREENKKYIFSKLGVEGKINYSIIFGGYDKYRDNLIGAFILNYPANEENKMKSILTNNDIEWRDL